MIIRARRRSGRWVAKRAAVGAYYNSGQVCISVQRIYGQREIYEPVNEKFVKASEAMVVGDPLDDAWTSAR
ncbi:MAG: aldehyde dehydrogenase family protein [Anaerolineae bacterium]